MWGMFQVNETILKGTKNDSGGVCNHVKPLNCLEIGSISWKRSLAQNSQVFLVEMQELWKIWKLLSKRWKVRNLEWSLDGII